MFLHSVTMKNNCLLEPMPFSREVDTVIDAGSSTGYTMVAALKEGRNAVWLNTSASQCEHSTLHSKISSLISSDI